MITSGAKWPGLRAGGSQQGCDRVVKGGQVTATWNETDRNKVRNTSGYLWSQVTRLELAGQGLYGGSQQIRDRVVKAGQVNSNPGPQEDDVTHEGLVFESGPEGPILTALNPWPQRLRHKVSYKVQHRIRL